MGAAALRYEEALRVAHGWHGAADAEELPLLVLHGLRRLVEADAVGWNELDLATGRLRAITVPDEGLTASIDTLERLAGQHPLIVHLSRNPLCGPVSISDFRTRRELRRLDIYHEFFKPHRIEYQCGFGIAGDDAVAVALNRSRRDFTQEERRFLDLLRPHIVAAFASVRARAEAQQLLARAERALEAAGREVVVLDPAGRIEQASERARRLLRGYDVARIRLLELTTAEGRVTVRRVDAEPPLLLLDVERRPPELDRVRAAAHRLTRRELEILGLVALDYTSEQIAGALSISVRTVDKHVEHALDKLCVRSRREAVALLLAA
ncbi:MAG TPA: helix-turn-helix transcriptional regulator [Gaiellaceae bacterium]|nr:helix-turn-helix transcriptional regulator [Gaiellaceae bacterium]